MTYVGAWLPSERGVGVENDGSGLHDLRRRSGGSVASLRMVVGSRRQAKRHHLEPISCLRRLFLIVARLEWGWLLWAGIALLGVAASARQAPLHALTTEIVGPEIRGEYTAIRNAASQLGIATAAAISSYVFDRAGFTGVSVVAAAFTILIPITCIWLRER